MAPVLRGIWSYAEFAACCATFIPWMGVVHARHRGDPTQRVPGQWMRRLGRTTANLCPLWHFSVEGQPPADIHGRPYMVVANHESTADPFLLSFLPWDMRWVGKIELFKMPVLGRAFRYAGDIAIERGNKDSVVAMIAECKKTLSHGMSIMMFPEGTRTTDGELGPFKPGAFEIAIEAGVPILPVAIAGTRACRPKGSLWFGEAKAIAKVLEPISTEGLTKDDVQALAQRARARIAESLPDLRSRATMHVESAMPAGAHAPALG